MAAKDILAESRMKGAMDELMKSEEGRELAAKLRSKLKQLNDEFAGLSGDEKTKFLGEFREKFTESLGEIKDSIKSSASGEFKIRGDESGDSAPSSVSLAFYLPFLIAVLIIVLVFGQTQNLSQIDS